MKNLIKTLIPVVAILTVVTFVILVMGDNPFNVFQSIIWGAFGSATSIGYTLFYSTPLVFTGLSVVVALRAGLFNIGAEGQLYIGSLSLVAYALMFKDQAGAVAILGAVVAALLGGALWGSLVGLLKAFRGSHEVVVSIMLNFVSYALCGYFILNQFKNPFSQNPETSEVEAAFRISNWEAIFPHAPVNNAALLAVFCVGLVWWLLYRSQWGFDVRFVGESPEAARRAGLPVRMRLLQVMAVSGALAGLVGVNEILGFSHKMKDQFSPGYGFMGIAVALLARGEPLRVIPAALLFGMLQKGSLDLEIDSQKMTRDLAYVIQGVVMIAVAAQPYLSKKLEKRWELWTRN
ncbi:MAG: ABC transporter permease [Oligoflexia bacterium]|nr:ABC transporter permease [Oligoflexia bacterium]